jgi:TRAP-type C4-dicarboxylate transport system substrate-binding protein
MVVLVRLAWLALPVLALAAAGCSGGTKAGGQQQPHPVVLAIADHEGDDHDLAEYVARVSRLSEGSIRLVLRNNWRPGDADYDRGTLADVRTGKVDLAKIAVRSYDELGVKGLQALEAPFLVDSLGLEQEVLGSKLPDRILPAIRDLGVQGLAILPGELQRPFGLERRLLGPSDYRGAVMGITPALVSRLTFERLGATPRPYLPGELTPWRFTGAPLDLFTLGEGAGYAVFGRSSVTANVAFWPQAFTVVGNSAVLAKLTSEQRDVLRRAGRDAAVPAIARMRAEDRAEVGVLCRRDRLVLEDATPRQVDALRAAVQPVYASLEQNPETRLLIGEIEAMKRHQLREPPPQCPAQQPRQRTATVLDGTWKMTATRAQASEVDAGHYRMVLRRGRVWSSFTSPGSSGWHATGVFSLRGDEIRFRYADGGAAVYHWNLYRETLTLRKVPGVAEAPNPAFAPWTRVGP